MHDYIDDRYANFWDDYVENSPNGFEKELNTCPIAKYWSKEPDLCEILFGDSLKGFAETLNPKFQTSGFTKLLTKGDKCCRYRIEMKDEWGCLDPNPFFRFFEIACNNIRTGGS